MNNLHHYFTYAGITPFLVCALLLFSGIDRVAVLGETATIVQVYTLVIATFLAGIHWGQHLQAGDSLRAFLAISSNIIAIGLWLAFLVLPLQAMLALCIVFFIALLAIDAMLHRRGLIDRAYFRTRCVASAIVIALLACVIITA